MNRYPVSNYGDGLDVLAGWSWYTTTKSGGSTIAGGTSIAAPQVSGLAALVWELLPDCTNTQIMQLIRQNTNRGDGVWDPQSGYGTIDMAKTLGAALTLSGRAPAAEEPKEPVPPPVAEERDTTPPILTLRGSSVIELTEGDTYEEPGYSASDDRDGDLTRSVTVSGTASTAYAGEYTLVYSVMDSAGNMAEATRTVIVSPAPLPPEDIPTEPVLTLIGSNPIILHLNGTPYTEQGANAFDEADGDLSAFVSISGEVDTSSAGTYQVNYSVTNSAGLSASAVREVRVLAPQETISRTPYSFSGQGKAGSSDSYSVTAEAEGEIELTVSGLNKAALAVSVIDSAGSEVFNSTFTGNGTQTFWVAEGTYRVETTIATAKGSNKYTISLLMPEVVTINFEEEEVPLVGLPTTDNPNTFDIVIMSVGVLALIGVGSTMILLLKKRRT